MDEPEQDKTLEPLQSSVPEPESEPVAPPSLAHILLALLLIVAAISAVHLSAANARAGRLAEQGPRLPSQDAQTAYLILAAQSASQQGAGAEAEQLLRRAIEVSPSPGWPMQWLGSVLAKDPRKQDEGLALFERGLRLAPPTGEQAQFLWANLAEAAMRARKYDVAVWAFYRAMGEGFQGGSTKTLLPKAYEGLGLKG